MKQEKILSVAIAFATMLALASCNQSDDIMTNGPRAVQFTAGIGEQAVATPQSRAVGTNWNQDDAIGVFMVKNKETSIASTYAGNKKFTTSIGNLFMPLPGYEIYYPLDENNQVDFIAYYPYKDEQNMDNKILVNTADQSRQTDFDIMWAKADNSGKGYNKRYPDNIPLTFNHRLARLTMNCKVAANTALADLDGMVVTIKGMNTATTFAVKDGAIGTATTKADFSARKTTPPISGGYLATYDAIIVPATYAHNDITVEFTVYGLTFTWNMGGMEFTSGNDYVYDVLLTLTGVKTMATINQWNIKTQGTVYAE